MGCLPVGAGTIIVVGEHFVVVNIHPGEQGAARRAAHWRRDVCVTKFGTAIPQQSQSSRHEIERTCSRMHCLHSGQVTYMQNTQINIVIKRN